MMARSLPEWIGKTPNAAIPPRVMLRVFMKFNGVCPKCSRMLRPKHWACDHIRALANGGEHRESNLQPLCVSPCHSDKTRADVAEKSKNYRTRSKAAGVPRPRRTIPGKRFNGEPIPARWVSR